MLTSGKLHTNIIDIFVGWKINEDAEMAALAKSFSVLNIQLRWFPLPQSLLPLFCGERDIIIHVGTGPAYGPLKIVKKIIGHIMENLWNATTVSSHTALPILRLKTLHI